MFVLNEINRVVANFLLNKALERITKTKHCSWINSTIKLIAIINQNPTNQ
jgi:hypothetical protein